MVAELIPAVVTLLVVIIIIVLISIVLLVRYCYMQRFARPQAYLCVQVGNVQNSVNLEWAEMVHPSDFYLLDLKCSETWRCV
jgi:hypothetical protein